MWYRTKLAPVSCVNISLIWYDFRAGAKLTSGTRAFRYRQILVYIFCLISIGLSLSDKANEMKFWILKEHNNFSYRWKSEPDIPNSFVEILFENPPNLQRMCELINVSPPSNLAIFNCCYFLCYLLQRAKTCTNCINWPALLIFEPNWYTYSYIFYGLTRPLRSRTVLAIYGVLTKIFQFNLKSLELHHCICEWYCVFLFT